MPEWLQVWIVVVSTALVAIALFAVATIKKFLDKLSSDLSLLTQTVQGSASRFDRVADQTGALLTNVKDPIQRVVQSFEVVGRRTADLGSSLLDQVEPPLQTASALLHGVRTGTGFLVNRLMHRFTHPQTRNNGGQNHER